MVVQGNFPSDFFVALLWRVGIKVDHGASIVTTVAGRIVPGRRDGGSRG